MSGAIVFNARSNSGVVCPSVIWPRLPPCAPEGQSECSRASSAKRAGSRLTSARIAAAFSQQALAAAFDELWACRDQARLWGKAGRERYDDMGIGWDRVLERLAA